ncbi:MAG: hypothetical protein ACRC5H_04845, partial [Treponemataceae bacterium]
MKKNTIIFGLLIFSLSSSFAEHDLYANIFAGMYPPYQTLNLDYDITFPLGGSLQYDYFSHERSVAGFSVEL